MTKIVFVDDESSVLIGLRNLLRKKRKEWTMGFAHSAAEARAMIDGVGVDLLVSDMRMPEEDGAQLLAWAQENHPHAIRMVLSGYSEMESVMRSVVVAHQYLSKPVDGVTLIDTLERALNLKKLLNAKTLRSEAAAIGNLPPVPSIYQELTQAMANPNATPKSIAAIINRDIALAAKVLQVANSGFFRAQAHFDSVEKAVVYLGTENIRNIAAGLTIFATKIGETKTDILESLQRHSFDVAALAQEIIPNPKLKSAAYLAGLLHDIGILLTIASGTSTQASDTWTEHENDVLRRQKTVNHDRLGAYLLGLWGLPYPVVEAVAYHQSPSELGAAVFDCLGAVHVADCIARLRQYPDLPYENAGFDMAFISRVGMLDQLKHWILTYTDPRESAA